MKEAISSPYAKLVFRETFNSEQSVRNNGGVPTAVTFEKGIGKFNGSTSKIKYQNINDGTYSVRIRFYFYNKSGYNWLFSGGGTTAQLDIGFSTGSTVRTYAGTTYTNGVASSTINSTEGAYNELIVTGLYYTKNKDNFYIGCYNNGVSEFTASSIELVEIYQGTLTANEVKNLYDNDWNKEFISSNLLLDYDSTNGYITDRTGKNTLTPSNVAIKKTGSYYGADFNGTTSKIDTGSDFIGTKAITVCGWIYNTNSIGYQRILDNSKFRLGLHTTNTIQVTSDQARFVYSLKTVPFNSWQFISITRKVDGKISFYLGDKSNSPVLNGSVDLDSGTPTVADSNVFIGSHPSGMTFFYGNIPMLKVYEGILDLETITQIWSSTRGKVL